MLNRILRKQVTLSFRIPGYLLPAFGMILIFSCTVPKKYQEGKPFVFQVHVKVEGNLKPSEKSDLELRLTNQLDDSLRTQVISYAGIYKKVVSPPVFDTTNIRRSIAYMVALLKATGYYAPTIRDTFSVKTVHQSKRLPRQKNGSRKKRKIRYDEQRVTVDFTVLPGKQLRFDSIGFNLRTPALQALALQHKQESLLKRGEPYAKQLVSAELDRLVNLFSNNGYYKFSKQDLVAVQDTVVAALINPNLDPFQQAALLEELKRKRERPTINVVIEQRPVFDSSRISQYHVGRVTIYPDLPVIEDTVASSTIDTTTARHFIIIARTNKFKPDFLARNVFLRPDSLFRLNKFSRTVNRFNQLGAWQQVSPTLIPSDNGDSLVDLFLRLYPAKKQNVNIDLEASRNTNDIITASNLFGVGLDLGLRNRNTFRESVLSSTNLRGGVELGADFIQTTQVSLVHTIYLPKVIPAPSRSVAHLLRLPQDSIRTALTFSAAYTDRYQFFTVQSLNAAWGYEWSKGNKSFVYRPLNIEYTKLVKTDSFQKYLDSIPSLNLAFKSGLVIGQQFIYNSVRKHGHRTNFFQFTAEESGALTGLVKSWDEGALWRYIKGDITYRHHIDFPTTQLAFRAYAGAGWAYGREGNGWEQTLPFYKAFFAGGPNSMRGWQVRQLGLGSSKFYDTAGGNKLIDRFGDVQLEANAEYRFPLGTILGVKLKSAVYVDAGNIWNRHQTDSAGRDVGSDFKFNRFYEEIAVDAGTGLRLDFDYFVIRLDYAYKLRDPQALVNSDRWFYGLQWLNGQFQLGINYPF